MTRREQETARKHLRERGLLEEREGSIKGKGRVLWFRVNYDALIEVLKQFSDEPGAASAETEVKRAGNDPEPSGEPVEGVHECARPDARDGLTAVSKSASGVARKRHTLLITTENTTETTQENTLTRARGALSLAP